MTNGEHLWEPDLCIIEGEILMTAGDEDGAEAKYDMALLVAREQGSILMELRAKTRLAGQFDRNGRREQATTSLREALGWFTEGFDTKDLKEARSLLESLGNE